jgi:hypothetical protein
MVYFIGHLAFTGFERLSGAGWPNDALVPGAMKVDPARGVAMVV